MSLLVFAQWVQSTDFFTALRGSAYTYPIVLTTHLCGIALFGGMVLMTDMRLLGWALRGYPISDLIRQLRPLKHLGLTVIVTCGVLMAGAKAEEYYYNVFFRTKMTLLALILIHGLVFRKSVYRNGAELDKAAVVPARAKLAAALSLILWTGMVIAGRGIGYVDAPLDKIHAGLFTSR